MSVRRRDLGAHYSGTWLFLPMFVDMEYFQ